MEANVKAEPTVRDLLAEPNALLTRSHLRDLGLGRRGIDAVIRACPAVVLPGYSRPLIRVGDYLALVEGSTYRDDRVRPTTTSPAGSTVGTRPAAAEAAGDAGLSG